MANKLVTECYSLATRAGKTQVGCIVAHTLVAGMVLASVRARPFRYGMAGPSAFVMLKPYAQVSASTLTASNPRIGVHIPTAVVSFEVINQFHAIVWPPFANSKLLHIRAFSLILRAFNRLT